MPKINPKDAPEGYVAMKSLDGSCKGCDLLEVDGLESTCIVRSNGKFSCLLGRKDKKSVIFVKKTRTKKKPGSAIPERVRPDSYKEQDGCWNCAYVFLKHEYDDGDELFCNRFKSRPKCGSVAMHESFWEKGGKGSKGRKPSCSQAQAALDAWYSWADRNRVSPNGICSYHKKLKHKQVNYAL